MTEADYIKESLNLYRLLMSALFSIILVIFWTLLINLRTWNIHMVYGGIFLGLVFCIFNIITFIFYRRETNELINLP